MYTIYKITDATNGKLYIGQTSLTIEQRLRAHFSRARNDLTRKNALVQAMREKSRAEFKIEPLEVCPDRDMADERERYWIAHFNSRIPNGYNQTRGGDNHGLSREEFQQRVSGQNHWTTRQSFTEETRAKMSVAQYGANSNNHRACMCIETGETFPYVKAVERKYGFSASHIHSVCKGVRKRCGGYHWKYIQDDEVIHNKE